NSLSRRNEPVNERYGYRGTCNTPNAIRKDRGLRDVDDRVRACAGPGGGRTKPDCDIAISDRCHTHTCRHRLHLARPTFADTGAPRVVVVERRPAAVGDCAHY